MIGAIKAAEANPQLTSTNRINQKINVNTTGNRTGLPAQADVKGSRKSAIHFAMPDSTDISGRLISAPKKRIMVSHPRPCGRTLCSQINQLVQAGMACVTNTLQDRYRNASKLLRNTVGKAHSYY